MDRPSRVFPPMTVHAVYYIGVVGDLDDLGSQVDDIRDAVQMLYEMIRDAKDDGATFDELIEATGFARGTLQNIVDGRSPKIWP